MNTDILCRPDVKIKHLLTVEAIYCSSQSTVIAVSQECPVNWYLL